MFRGRESVTAVLHYLDRHPLKFKAKTVAWLRECIELHFASYRLSPEQKQKKKIP